MCFFALLLFNSQIAFSISHNEITITDDDTEFDASNETPIKDIGREFYIIANSVEQAQNYFKNNKTLSNKFFFSPTELLIQKSKSKLSSFDDINLLNWDHIYRQYPDQFDVYNRKKQFGGWIKDPNRKTCLNIRGLVLIRDAIGEIVYDSNNPCRIQSSTWIDPYTHQEIHDANKIQIDHVVPLKEAYVTGAWQWSNKKKCTYANFIKNDFHLLSVLGNENSKKGDRSPERYLPPDTVYICKYLSNWLKIKAIWDLKISINEAQGIQSLIHEYNCNADQFEYSIEELDLQKQYSREIPKGCERR